MILTDAGGNQAVLDNATRITLDVAPGTPTSGGPGGLSCTSGLTVTASAGTGNFFGCRFRSTGAGYRLRASASGLTTATSQPFAVSAGAPVQIGFVRAPASVVVNEPFGAAVAVQDAGGNTVTTGTLARIRLALANNPGATGFACDQDEVATVAGIASFTGCRINVRAGGFTLSGDGVRGGTAADVRGDPIGTVPERRCRGCDRARAIGDGDHLG